MLAIILAGGRGIRLWPESRHLRPKQFCKFPNEKSMLQNTLERLEKAGFSRLLIVTGEDLKDAVEQVADQTNASIPIEILTEPEGRNTAPAIAFALSACLHEPPDTLLGIFPADHHIEKIPAFAHSLTAAFRAAKTGKLTLLGITPRRPETGYGYIEQANYEFASLPEVYPVQAFREKPTAELAQSYLESGRYSWNSGIYISRLDVLLQEYRKFLPKLYDTIQQGTFAFRRAYSTLPSISIDCAIAEKSDCLAVVNGDFGWCDLGSWNALGELYPADDAQNICRGADILALQSQNCLLKQQDKTLVLYDVQDLLVVETDDVVLITQRKQAQNILTIVSDLEQRHRNDLL